MPERVPAEVEHFIQRRIRSIEQLEVLLHLARQQQRAWTATELAAALRIAVESAAKRLEELAAGNLLDVRLGSDLAYTFSPVDPAERGAVAALSGWHDRDRFAVIALIPPPPPQALRDFSAAFRLRRPKDG